MWIAHTLAQARRHRHTLDNIAFVPTMGALHNGHLSLIQGAKKLAKHVIVSIFVNPTQFTPNEDFEQYPRPLEEDLAKCRRLGAAGVFCPDVNEMYPPDRPACEVNVPALTRDLEGRSRPHFFFGVCRVVAKLLNIVQPDVAIFGRKDYQQWRVVEAMAHDLAMPTRIVALPTIRESDGLAMSSRNAYLDREARQHATSLYKALLEARSLIEQNGETDPAVVEAAMTKTMQTHQVIVDYAVVRHPRWLTPLENIDPPLTDGVVALVAGHVAGVRLIDNMVIGASERSIPT